MAEKPGQALARFFVLASAAVPTDGGGVEQHVSTGQRHQPGRFRVPLIPAHQYTEATDLGIDRVEAQIARGEIELFEKARIIRNVHLAIAPGDAPIGAEHYRGGETGSASGWERGGE